MFVVAGSAVGSSTGTEFELAQGEVLMELVPFGLGGFAVLGRWPQRPTVGEKHAVGTDEFVLEHGQVGLRGVDAFVAEDLGGDVHRKTTGHGLGGDGRSSYLAGAEPARAI